MDQEGLADYVWNITLYASLQRLSVEKGNLRVNGDIVGLDYKLTNGDLIEHHIHRLPFSKILQQNLVITDFNGADFQRCV